MATLLQLDSSAKGAMSTTRPLTQYFAEQWKAANSDGKIIYHDLLKSDLKFVDEQIVAAFFTPPDKQSAEQKNILRQSDQFIEELFEAETYVFGTPMYNFSVPAVFKAYIDLVVRAGKTFSYDTGTPKGLLKDKQIIIVTASGGDYSKPPYNALDFVEPYLKGIFGFLGVSDVTVVSAPGRDPESIAISSKAAQERLKSLVKVHQLR